MPNGESVVTNNKNEAFPLLPTYSDDYYKSIYPHYPTNVATFKCPDDFTSIIYKWHIPMYITTNTATSTNILIRLFSFPVLCIRCEGDCMWSGQDICLCV